jgi:hypothetical protein
MKSKLAGVGCGNTVVAVASVVVLVASGCGRGNTSEFCSRAKVFTNVGEEPGNLQELQSAAPAIVDNLDRMIEVAPPYLLSDLKLIVTAYRAFADGPEAVEALRNQGFDSTFTAALGRSARDVAQECGFDTR